MSSATERAIQRSIFRRGRRKEQVVFAGKGVATREVPDATPFCETEVYHVTWVLSRNRSYG